MVLQEKITNIVIAGAGGQGNLFASRVLAQAAMNKGLEVKVAESYGVAQRGGSVYSQVRFGPGEFGPLVPAHHADAILGLEPLEALRLALDFVCPATVVVTNTHAVAPVQAKSNTLSYPTQDSFTEYYQRIRVRDVFELDAVSLAQDLGDAKAANMIMVGGLIGSDAIPLSLQDVCEAVAALSPSEVLQKQNVAALTKGSECTRLQRQNLGSAEQC
jgi:indolepyruvate ferredoxin oxidoreductase beta subunit